jgi:two-component system, sensor histidine kinase LadS
MRFWLRMKKTFLLIVLWLFSASLLIAQKPLIVSELSDEYLVTVENIRFYQDTTRSLNHKNVLKQEFGPLPMGSEIPDFTTSDFWFRLTIQNNSKSDRWLLEILEFGIPKVAFYDIYHDSLIETGYSEAFKTRAYNHKNFVFDLSIPSGETRTYLVKASATSPFGPVMKIRSHELFNSYANSEYLLLGLYYGLLVLISLYNLSIYISIRDSSHLFYVFYVMAIGLRSLQWDGLGFQYLWPSFPELNQWLTISPQLLLVSFSAYAINFLELRRKYRVYYKIILYSVIGYILLYLIDLFFPVPYIQLVYLIPFFITYGISVIIYQRGYKPARFFVLGYSLLIISQILNFLFLIGVHMENKVLILLFVYSLNIGFVIETFIFSLALADKIKIFKNEKEEAQQITIDQLKINEELKDKVNRELELKVSERTKELEDAKAKLQEQTEKINDMNRLLDLENFRLRSNVKEINIERGLLKTLSIEEFVKTFPDENACFRFIDELKWGDGYTCYKCGGHKYLKGNDPFARRCTKCQYIETIKANTIFHNLKFPIEKAFQMIYMTLSSEKEISTYELAEKLKLQQKTCWSFRQKIIDKITRKQISKKDLMEKGWVILIKE